MGFLDVLDKGVELTASFLEMGANDFVSRNKSRMSEEQKQELLAYSARMRDIKHNGLFSQSSNNFYEEETDDYSSNLTVQEQRYENSQSENETYNVYNDYSSNLIVQERQYNDQFEYEYKSRRQIERERDRKRLESIRCMDNFCMKIDKTEYAEKKSGKGYVLSGRIVYGGIFQAKEEQKICISYDDDTQTEHRLISILCYSNHKKYNYAKKGQYVRLFIEADKMLDLHNAKEAYK